MIGTWPDSKHVDNAMLLIANCLFHQTRYDECVAQIDSLEIKHPTTDLLADARFLKGKALAEWGQYVEAVQVLEDYMETFRKHKSRPEALYYLATSSISLGREDAAARYMDELEDRYGNASITFEAQLEVAKILSEKGHYDKSREVYEAMNRERLPRAYRFGVWLGLAEAYVRTGEYAAALTIVRDIEDMVLTVGQEPAALLVKARAYSGLDSADATVETYRDVSKRFSRGKYGAEARFRLGEIFEAADSLQKAKRSYDSVARAYSRSEFAAEAIRRSGSIAKLLRLEQMKGDDSPEAQALREFSLAELQFTHFDDPERAVETYEKMMVDYPDTEFVPNAIYAVGYIHGIVFGDTLKARDAYELLQVRFPDSQQARFAFLFVAALDAPDDVLSADTPADSLLVAVAVDTAVVARPSAPIDTVAVDTVAAPLPADTTSVGEGEE